MHLESHKHIAIYQYINVEKTMVTLERLPRLYTSTPITVLLHKGPTWKKTVKPRGRMELGNRGRRNRGARSASVSIIKQNQQQLYIEIVKAASPV